MRSCAKRKTRPIPAPNRAQQVAERAGDRDVAREPVRQIVDGLGDDLKYVSVGNEPDINSVNGNWPYLGADGSTGDERRANALAHYAAGYLAYRRAVAGVKPDLTYALGELGDWSPAGLGPDLDAVLSPARRQPTGRRLTPHPHSPAIHLVLTRVVVIRAIWHASRGRGPVAGDAPPPRWHAGS